MRQARRGGRLERALVGAALAFVLWFYFWTVKTAGGFEPNAVGDYYYFLVRGFEQGHIWMTIEPQPQMRTLADPYDPAQNAPYRVADASYFNGKYYLYMGPTPALGVFLPYAVLTGRYLPSGAAVFVYVSLGFLAGSAVWLAVRRRYYPASGWLAAPLGVLVIGLCSHALALARRPMFWESSIAAGFAFAMLALGCVYLGLCARRAPRLSMLLAGVCLGLAFASRPPYAFATLLFLPVVAWAWRHAPRRGEWLRGPLLAAAGFLICFAGVLAYNYARFGQPLEFGQNYQLSGVYESKMKHFGLRYLWHNFYVYYLRPVAWTWDFPWVSQLGPLPHPPRGYYGGEEIGGLWVTMPVLLLALGAVRVWLRATPPGSPEPALRAFVGSLAILYASLGVFLLAFFSATERYLADFAPALALLAAVGGLEIEKWVQPHRALVRTWRVFAPALAIVSCLMGMLMSCDYHGRQFRLQSPETWRNLQLATQPLVAKLRHFAGVETGRLMARVEFSAAAPSKVEVLRVLSPEDGSAEFLVEYVETNRVRLGVRYEKSAPRWTLPLATAQGRKHLVAVQYPVTAEEKSAQLSMPLPSDNLVAVWFDGAPVLTFLPQEGATTREPRPATGEFSGHATRRSGDVRKPTLLDALPSAPWVLAGVLSERAGERATLLTWIAGGRGGAFVLERTTPGQARLVYLKNGDTAAASEPFALGTAPASVEISHPPVWPWSSSPGEEGRFDFVVEGRPVWAFNAVAEAVLPEDVVLTPTSEGQASSWRATTPNLAEKGGVLRLRLVLPKELSSPGEPLVSLGARGAGDLLGVRADAGGRVRFLFDHWGAPLIESAPVAMKPGRVYVVDIELPSLASATYGQLGRGELLVHLDGRQVLRATTECAGFQEQGFDIGRNPLGGTTFGASFTGTLLEWRWLKTRSP